MSIYRMPPVLLIQLKRFSYSGPFRSKIATLVGHIYIYIYIYYIILYIYRIFYSTWLAMFIFCDFLISMFRCWYRRLISLQTIWMLGHSLRYAFALGLLTGQGPAPLGAYSLYGVCNHTGTLTGGHYTSYCKNAYSQRYTLRLSSFYLYSGFLSPTKIK